MDQFMNDNTSNVLLCTSLKRIVGKVYIKNC